MLKKFEIDERGLHDGHKSGAKRKTLNRSVVVGDGSHSGKKVWEESVLLQRRCVLKRDAVSAELVSVQDKECVGSLDAMDETLECVCFW